LAEDPKLLPHQEEATYAEPILMPQTTTVNKTMTLTPSNVLNQQQHHQNTLGNGSVVYSTTSPKATLRKVHNGNNGSAAPVGALFETCPSPCPSSNNGLYAPYSDHNGVGSNAYGRDPYSSFRSRDPYSGSMRSSSQQQQYAQPLDPIAPFGTLRGGGHNKSNLAENNYGTARSVKKVYL